MNSASLAAFQHFILLFVYCFASRDQDEDGDAYADVENETESTGKKKKKKKKHGDCTLIVRIHQVPVKSVKELMMMHFIFYFHHL